MELQSIIHFALPYDYDYNMRNWVIQHVINIYLSFFASYIVGFEYILNYIYIFNLIGHLQVLKEEIKSFLHVREFGKDKEKLTKIITHHAFIIK